MQVLGVALDFRFGRAFDLSRAVLDFILDFILRSGFFLFLIFQVVKN